MVIIVPFSSSQIVVQFQQNIVLKYMKDKNQNNDIIFYTTPKGNVKIAVVFNNETFWLTQKAMAELFGVKVPAISKHLTNIFDTNELAENSVISILETTAADGKKYKTSYYSLDAIIAVGYRVNSNNATQFRIWATKTLREFIIKGFVLDDERLKQGNRFGKDYFNELLDRIREIRASERRFYLKITDIYQPILHPVNFMVESKVFVGFITRLFSQLSEAFTDFNKSFLLF